MSKTLSVLDDKTPVVVCDSCRTANESDLNLRWQSEDGRSFLAEADAFEFLDSLAENSIDCIWTDPPYLLSNDGITCVAGAHNYCTIPTSCSCAMRAHHA